jgi:hypothetical protein
MRMSRGSCAVTSLSSNLTSLSISYVVLNDRPKLTAVVMEYIIAAQHSYQICLKSVLPFSSYSDARISPANCLGKIGFGYVRLVMRLLRGLCAMASSLSYLANWSISNVGISECRRLKCIYFEDCPVAQHPQKIS